MPDTTTRAQEIPEGVKRWRKMPAEPEVQAVQLLDNDDLDWYAIAAWCGGEVGVQAAGGTGEFESYIEIPGVERRAYEGAWIVQEPGGFRVREDFVFAEVYELAPLADPAATAGLLTMGAFRSLTAGVPDDWEVGWVMRTGEDSFTHHHADASVDVTNRCVEVIHD